MKKGKVQGGGSARPAEKAAAGEVVPLKPRKGLFIALGVVFVLWVVGLIVMRVVAVGNP